MKYCKQDVNENAWVEISEVEAFIRLANGEHIMMEHENVAIVVCKPKN